MDKEIFTLVSKEEEKIKLFVDLSKARGEILCKGQGENICRLRAYSYNVDDRLIECLHDSTESLKNGEEFLGHFFLGGEKYYFQANAKVSKDQYSIPLPEELYHLQRRQNYRVKVPEGYGAFYDIFSVNGKEQNMKGQVIDISSQGCRIIYKTKTPVMQLGDKVIGHLRIKDATPLELKGEVRHFKLDEGPHPAQTFGIEFTPINPIMENKLFAITLEIHKEFFR